MKHTILGLSLVACTAVGCVGPPAAVPSNQLDSPSRAGSTSASAPPLDGAMAAVSKSHPGPDASAALDACSLTDTTGRFGSNGPLGIDLVEGMGLVPHARDVPKYALLIETTPEIQTDAPAWVITTKGRVRLPLVNDILVNPTCLVIGRDASWITTGDYIQPDGTVKAAPQPKFAPIYSLPSLAP